MHEPRPTITMSLCLLVICCAIARAAEPIPPDKRIPASVVATIAAPADSPLHMPTDVAVDSKGRIYVADGANNRVLCFSPVGQLEHSFTQAADVNFKKPVGIAVDASDQLWIADTANHRLVLVSADGETITPIIPEKLDEQGACDPTDIAVTPDGKRTYVIDNDNHRVLLRDNVTRKWTALGKHGRTLGQFQWPFMVCIGAENYVYISEAIGARIQLISPTDKWAGEVGRWGVELGQLYRPKGVAADSTGRLFVSDSTTGVVQVFSSRGAIEGVLTDKDAKPLHFEHPMGLCFDANGRLYVVELKANRVAVVSVSWQEN